MRSICAQNRACPGALLATVLCLAFAAAPAAAASFGTGCQQDYQNGWQTNTSYVWARCSGLNNRLDDTDAKLFYYNLHNAKWWWEEPSDWTIDNVSLFYNDTHGGGWADKSVWAMWDQGMLADSLGMRLGDDGTGLGIFATYSCETLKFNDGRLWLRMGSLFRGGLLYAAGSHDKLYDAWTTDETGEDFAGELQSGKSIRYSWKDGNGDWYVDNDAAVMATGVSSADCGNRRDNMSWWNFTQFPRLRDGAIGWYCYTYWDDL